MRALSIINLGPNHRPGVDTAIGKLTLTVDYVEKTSSAFLGSSIAHDARHVQIAEFMMRSGFPKTDPIMEERDAMRFQLRVGMKTGLDEAEVHYIQDLVRNPEQLRSWILMPGPGN
jgi:hypothetical protein